MELKRFKKLFGLYWFLDHLKVNTTLGRLTVNSYRNASDFKGTRQPDPTISPDFLTEMKMSCQDSNRTTTQPSSLSMAKMEMTESAVGMS